MEPTQDPVIYAVPVFVLMIVLELGLIGAMPRFRALRYDRREALASIGMGIGVAVIGGGWKLLMFAAFMQLYEWAPEAGRAFLALDSWHGWAIGFLADDFSFYWHHRLSHSVRLLWAAHENHHSARSINFAVALRQSWVEVLYKFLFWAWMPLVGFHPLMIFVLMSVSLIYQFFQHTELVGNLGPLGWVFNTPSHHRVHHATNIRYLDRNHAGVLIIWDRLFGTFSPERPAEEPPEYGVRSGFHSNNLLKIAFQEYVNLWRDVRSAESWRARLGYIFGPPGWQPGEAAQTTSALRQRNGLS